MKSPTKFSLLPFAFCLLASASGCRQDMHNQPKYRPLRATTFFADGSSARPLVEGTVARGTLQEDQAFFTGKVGTAMVRELPFPVDDAVLTRGQERYNIFCTPCHDATGRGRGMVVQRGYKQPPSFHEERLRNVEAGYFFDVMTNGFGGMPDYRDAAGAARSVGGGRLHPRPAAQSARRGDGRPGGRSDQGAAGAGAARCGEARITHAHTLDQRRSRSRPHPAARAHRRRDRPAGGRDRRRDEHRSVLPIVADRLPVLPEPVAGLARAADAPAPLGRPVGHGRTAGVRGGQPPAAGGGDSRGAGDHRHPADLCLGAARRRGQPHHSSEAART